MLYDKNIAVLIVTYADRRSYLFNLLKSLGEIDSIRDVIIVFNGTDYDPSFLMDSIGNSYKYNMHAVSTQENLGSAGGFNAGLKYVIDEMSSSKYLFILDDDAYVNKTCIEKLIDFSIQRKGEVILQARRSEYKPHDQLFSGKTRFRTENCFMGFDFISTCIKITAIFSPRVNTFSYPSFVPVPYTGYSGLFIPIKLLDKNNLPNPEYYLYTDDADYTYSFSKSGTEILVVRDALILDQEISWVSEKKFGFALLACKSDLRAYYVARNDFYFELKNYITFNVKFFVNFLL